MNRLKALVRKFFGFSRTETNGFVILLPLIALFIFSAPAYQYFYVRFHNEEPDDLHTLDSITAHWTWTRPKADSVKIIEQKLFLFNPNTAVTADLVTLGIAPKLAARIINYRTKGGKFKIKSDLKKIYGMDSVLLARIYPWIDLPEKASKAVANGHAKNEKRTQPYKKPVIIAFDINLADTSQLIRINGIGPKLSLRIIAYRNRLGGFISMDQLNEIYGLDTVVIARLAKRVFIEPGYRPRQINLNRAEIRDLTALPYISFALAKAITTYRFQHGDFTSVDELKQIVSMTDAVFEKIKSYLTVKE